MQSLHDLNTVRAAPQAVSEAQRRCRFRQGHDPPAKALAHQIVLGPGAEPPAEEPNRVEDRRCRYPTRSGRCARETTRGSDKCSCNGIAYLVASGLPTLRAKGTCK